MSRPRSAMSASPSSRPMAPATQAAASSPTLWPITKDGVIPQAHHCSASAYSRANSAGWV
ncbi:MAG: hypothetical protein QM767_16390 [Anaeromyxobacter sp.]